MGRPAAVHQILYGFQLQFIGVDIALVGGTGDIGEGLALRLARDTDHDITIGSREKARAVSRAEEYSDTLRNRGCSTRLDSAANATAVRGADVVVFTVPPYYLKETIRELEPHFGSDAILISPAVGMNGDDDGLHYKPPETGSVGQMVAEVAPPSNPVVCAFTNLSAARLTDLDDTVAQDTLIVGDDDESKAVVASIVESLDGITPVDAGPLANAPEVESLTVLLINIARYNERLENAGAKFV